MELDNQKHRNSPLEGKGNKTASFFASGLFPTVKTIIRNEVLRISQNTFFVSIVIVISLLRFCSVSEPASESEFSVDDVGATY